MNLKYGLTEIDFTYFQKKYACLPCCFAYFIRQNILLILSTQKIHYFLIIVGINQLVSKDSPVTNFKGPVFLSKSRSFFFAFSFSKIIKFFIYFNCKKERLQSIYLKETNFCILRTYSILL